MHTRVNPHWDLATAISFLEHDLGYKGLYTSRPGTVTRDPGDLRRGRRDAVIARRPALHLFLFSLALYALTSSGNAFRVPDEFEVYFQAEHLVDAGDLSVPQTLAIRQGGDAIFFGELGRDGRPYAPYGPGVAFLILPFHLLGRMVAAAAGVPRAPFPEGIAWEFLVGGITTLAMACAAALTVAGFFRAAIALGSSPRTARQLALILSVATMLWPYGTTLYSEAWLAAAFVWAAWALLDARQGGSILARPHHHRVAASCRCRSHQANRARHRAGLRRRDPARHAHGTRRAMAIGAGVGRRNRGGGRGSNRMEPVSVREAARLRLQPRRDDSDPSRTIVRTRRGSARTARAAADAGKVGVRLGASDAGVVVDHPRLVVP